MRRAECQVHRTILEHLVHPLGGLLFLLRKFRGRVSGRDLGPLIEGGVHRKEFLLVSCCHDLVAGARVFAYLENTFVSG